MHPETAHQGQQKAPISDASRLTTLKELAREYWANRPMELAAALSYYTLLSLAPLVLLFATIFKACRMRPSRGQLTGRPLGPGHPVGSSAPKGVVIPRRPGGLPVARR